MKGMNKANIQFHSTLHEILGAFPFIAREFDLEGYINRDMMYQYSIP